MTARRTTGLAALIAMTAGTLVLSTPAAAAPALTQATAPADFTLTLLHNNDGESALLPAAPRGGIARFGTLVNELRAQAGEEGSGVLLLSSGDNYLAGPQLQASLENYDGDVDYDDDGPFYDAVAMDYLGYDASAVGNHEFDFGPNVLGYFMSQFQESDIRFVSSNLDVSGSAALEQFVEPSPGTGRGALVEWTRTRVEGRSVAIVGATTPRLASISSPGPDVQAREQVREAVQDAIDAATADEETDVVVLIAHLQNIAEDRALVAQLSDLDVAIAGGGDELLANPDDVLLPGAGTPFGPYPIFEDSADDVQVPIVTTQGSYGYVGRLILDFDADGRIVEIDERSGPVRNVFDAANPPADQQEPDAFLLANVEAPVAAYRAELGNEVVATTQPRLDGTQALVRTGETNLGSLFADALRVSAEQAADFGATNPTVSIQNSGGIRNSVVRGPDQPITRLDTFTIAPFSNFVGYTLGLAPAKLKQLLEHSVSAAVDPATGQLQAEGRFGQWSGVEFVYDPARPAQTVSRDPDTGVVTVTGEGQRIRQVTLTNNTPDRSDDVVVVRNGVLVPGAPSVDLAANSFTVGQNGDNYPFNLTEGQFVNLPVTYQQSLEGYLRQLGTVTAAQYPEGGLGRIVVGSQDVAEPVPGPGPAPVPGPGPAPLPGPVPVPVPVPSPSPSPEPTTGAQEVVPRTPQAATGARAADDSCPAGQVPSRQFPDVPSDSTHAASIRCVAWFGVAQGFTDGRFGPAQGVRRGQMASFIARTIQATTTPLPAPGNRFSDDDGTTHERAIEQLAAAGIVLGGTDGRFRPDDVVTRAQMTSFLVRSYRYVSGVDLPLPTTATQYFDDVAGLTQRDDVNRAAAVGLTEGTRGRTFSPQDPTLRGQMATFLTRLLDLLVEDGKVGRPTG